MILNTGTIRLLQILMPKIALVYLSHEVKWERSVMVLGAVKSLQI